MLNLITMYIIICVLLFFSFCVGYKGKKAIYIIGCLLMITFSIFRDITVGADTGWYSQCFIYINRFGTLRQALSFGWEPLYIVINRVIGYFTENEYIFLAAISFLIIVPIFRSIRRYSSFPIMSLLIYLALGYYYGSNGVFRLWLSIAILTFSYKYIIDRNFIKFMIVCCIAFFMHRTAIVFVPAYFLYNMKINDKILFSGILAGGFLGMFGDRIVLFLNQFARIQTYEHGFNGGIANLVFIWMCLLIIYFFIKGREISDKERLFFNMLWIAAIMQPISLSFSIWSRIVNYFAFSLVYLIPNTIDTYLDTIDNKSHNLWAILLMLSVVLFLRFYLAGIPEFTLRGI